ncbi:MAG: AMP-binding protein [Gemmatimonadaceae bacterium]
MSSGLVLHPDTVLAHFRAHAVAVRDDRAFSVLGGASWSWGEWWQASMQVAAALVRDGVQRGDRVAILAPNTPLWPIADVGVMLAGAVSVGIFPTAAPAQVAEVLADSGAVFALADGAAQIEKVLDARAALPALQTVVGGAGDVEGASGWDAWMESGAHALDDSTLRAAVERRAADVAPADRAAIVYTSGSTGRAKGALISHATLLASAQSVATTLSLGAGDRSLSFLPYCHAGERIFGHCTRLLTGMSATLVPHSSLVWQAAEEFSPTIFGGTPRFFERAAEALRAAMRNAGDEDCGRWQEAERLGRARSRLRQQGSPVPAELEGAWSAAVNVASPVLHAHFGTALRVATSGGATLNVDAAALLDAFGVTVLGAYGQTEHLCGTMHRPEAYDFSGVGMPMPGSEVRIAADGEILFRRGALTFDGYHELDRESAEAFTPDAEWLRTGDLGALLPNGGLQVTGRKKELIALSTGKKVAPLPIESALEGEDFIAHAVCVGEGEKFLAALLTLRAQRAEEWARERGVAPGAAAAAPEVLAAVSNAVERVNARLSQAEQIKRWTLLPEEFSVEGGELTSLQKIRRAEIVRIHAASLRALYT